MVYLIILCFFSCNKKNTKEEYYYDGSIKIRVQTNKKGVFDGFYEEFYEGGMLKRTTKYKNSVISDTLYSYHKNGKLKSKGLQKDYMPYGWWNHYDMSGNLKKCREFKIIDNESFLNQEIKYNQKGEIDYKESTFLTLFLDDTLSLGGNIGEISYHHHQDTLGFRSRFIRIIIDNHYPDKLIKKDTFTGDEKKNWFGVYADKPGKKQIYGKVEEELIFVKKINKDSSVATVSTTTKYFEKEVYVKDTID